MSVTRDRCDYCHGSAETLDERGLCTACSPLSACARCGMPNIVADRSAICPTCRLKERRGRPKVNNDLVREIRAALFVPPDEQLQIIIDPAEEHSPGRKVWCGWKVELFHVSADFIRTGPDHPARNPALLHPWIALIPHNGFEQERLVFYWRAWHPQIQGQITWWWSPRRIKGSLPLKEMCKQGLSAHDRWDMSGFQPAHYATWSGLLKELRTGPPRGGRKGITIEQDQELFGEIVKEYARLEMLLNQENDSSRAKSVSQREVADALCWGMTKITDLLTRCSLAPQGDSIAWWQVWKAARDYATLGTTPRIFWRDLQKAE